MFEIMEVLAGLYTILIMCAFGFFLYMVFRFVKAVEKIASSFDSKHK